MREENAELRQKVMVLEEKLSSVIDKVSSLFDPLTRQMVDFQTYALRFHATDF